MQHSEISDLHSTFNAVFRRFLKMPDDDFYKVLSRDLANFDAIKKVSPADINVKSPYQRVIEIYNSLEALSQFYEDSPEESFSTGKSFGADEIAALGRKKWQYRTFSFIKKYIENNMSDEILSVTLHGSYGTLDYVEGWSDADIIVFLKTSVFETPMALKKFKQNMRRLSLFLYKIDPLTHHEFILITPFDRKHYSRSFFPPALFSFGKRLFGEENIKCAIRDDSSDLIHKIFKLKENFAEKCRLKKWSGNLYDWKNDLSHMMILPSLMLQVKGIEIYKRESFAKVRQVFPEVDFSAIDRAGEVMRTWNFKNFLRFYPDRLIYSAPYVLNKIIIYMYKKMVSSRKPSQSRDEIASLTCDFSALAEKSFESVK